MVISSGDLRCIRQLDLGLKRRHRNSEIYAPYMRYITWHSATLVATERFSGVAISPVTGGSSPISEKRCVNTTSRFSKSDPNF